MNTSIHNKIAHVTEYFIDKLERGMYEVKDVESHTAHIVIDGEFNFHIWIASGWSECKQYASVLAKYPVWLPEFSDDLKMDLYAKLQKVKEDRKKEAVQKKMDELRKEMEYLERQAA